MNNPTPPSLRHSKPLLLLASLLGVLLLGLIDYVMGYELSFAIFYLLPIAFAAWYTGRRTALVLALLSVIVWHLANRAAGQTFSHPLIPYWNGGIRQRVLLATTGDVANVEGSCGPMN